MGGEPGTGPTAGAGCSPRPRREERGSPGRCWGRGRQQPTVASGLYAGGGRGGKSSLPARAVPTEEGEASRPGAAARPSRGHGGHAAVSLLPPNLSGLQLPARPAPKDYNSRQAPRGALPPAPAQRRRRTPIPARAPPTRGDACAAAAGRGRGMRGGGSAVIGGARREGGAAAAILGAGQRAAAAGSGR